MPTWLQELLLLVSMLPSTTGAVPALEVPTLPVTSGSAVTGASEVFADGFDAPYAERWTHLSTSTADKVGQSTVDGRTVLELRPEAHLEFGMAVPFEPGTTYRVSATLKMPKETGVHPAFWLRTNDLQRAGEMDVVESWGDQLGCGRVQVAYYWRYAPPIGDVECAGDRYPQDMDAWHTYSVEFTYQGPGQDPAAEAAAPTRFFVDGVETWSTPHAPVSAEHLRLQNKRNCPDDQQPTCGGQTSTSPSMYVDDVAVEIIGRVPSGVPADLTAIRRTETGADAHVLSSDSGFTSYSNQTQLPLTGRGWRFTGGDFDGDRAADVYAVRMAGRNTAQVQVLDGGDYLHSSLNHSTIVERRGGLGRTRFLAGDVDGDGRDDLYLLSNGANGAHLTVLDASTDFQTRLADLDLQVPTLPRDRWRIAVGDYDFDGRDDLYLVDTQAGEHTAVHVLDARTEFMSWLAQTNTAAPELDSTWVATAADDNGDGRAELVLVDRDADGATETHALDAATGFATYTREVRTALGPTTDSTWTIAN